MAKRRRSKQDPVSGLLGLSFLVVFYFAFDGTKSLTAAGIITGIWFGICLAGAFIYRQIKEDRLRRSDIHDIDKMDGRQFEHYLGQLYKSQGYKVIVTRAAGDYGADLVIEKDKKRIVVQAKRYSKNVGIEAVQQAQASIAHYKVHEAWVVSNRNYTTSGTEICFIQ